MDKLIHTIDKLKSLLSNGKQCLHCGYLKRINVSSCNRYCPVCSTKFSKNHYNDLDTFVNYKQHSPELNDVSYTKHATKDEIMEKLLIRVESMNEYEEFPYSKVPAPSYRNSNGEKYNDNTQRSLKIELLETGIITEDMFMTELAFCKERLKEIKKNNLYSFNTNNDLYDIRFGQSICIEHLLALRFYCNYSKLAGTLLSNYSRFYWFGRFLYEVIEFIGKPLKQNENVYMIINKKVLFRDFNTKQIFDKPLYLTRNHLMAQKCMNKKHENIIVTLTTANRTNDSRFIEYNKIIYNENVNDDMLLFFGRYSNNLIINNIEMWSDYQQKKIINFQFEMECLNYWSSLMGDNTTSNVGDNNTNIIYSKQNYISDLISLSLQVDEVDTDHYNKNHIIDDKLKYVFKLFQHYRIHKNGIIVLNNIHQQFATNHVSLSLRKCLKSKTNNIDDKILQKLYPNCSFILYKA